MKNTKKVLALLLACSMGLGMMVSAAADNESGLSTEEKTAILQDAYIFTLPLMMIDATATAMTNTLRPNTSQAPANQLCHAEKLADAEFRNVVTPNVDTIYSQMILDLDEDAVILELPRTERFCTAQLLDAYTNTVAVIDASSFENQRQSFIFTGPDFAGEIPEGMSRIEYPSNLGWMIIRTICFDKADEAKVHEIQGQMKAYTLKQYLEGSIDEAPEGSFDEKNEIVPSQHVLGLPMDAYFERANELLAANPPAEADSPMMERIAKIGVGPGLSFDSGIFGDAAGDMWKSLVGGIVDITGRQAMKFFTRNGSWSYMGAPIGDFGTEYGYRAFIAIYGLGANPVSVAVYPKADSDSEGNRITGDGSYVLHFEKGQLPPVEGLGFWSVTAYNSENNFLIDNEIDRYCINNRSEVSYNEDGSLDILIQAERPEEREENWLPVMEGEFHLVLRIYMPGQAVVTNQWPTPVLSAVK